MKEFALTAAAMLIAGASYAQATGNSEYSLTANLGVCTSTEYAQVFKDNGFSYIEVSVSGFLIPEASDEEFAKNLASARSCVLPIKCANGFYPGDLKLTGPDADLDRAVRYAAKAFERAEMVGIQTIVLGSGTARRIPDGFDPKVARKQFISLLKAIGPLARKHGVTVVIEPLRTQETNFINSVREGTSIARKAHHPNICVLADIYHMTQVGEDPGAIIEAGKTLRHCHIAENEKRTAPGIAGDDFRPYFEALKAINYKGRMSVEAGWDNDIPGNAPKAMETMTTQIMTSNRQ